MPAMMLQRLVLPTPAAVKACLADGTDHPVSLGLALAAGEDLAGRLSEWVLALARELDLGLGGVRVSQARHPDQQCPRFHVDTLPFRVIVTLAGPGTQWVSDAEVDREALVAEEACGVPADAVRALARGEIALLPGKTCPFRVGRGTFHRSPPPLPGQSRLVLTVDPT
ncbi:MAG: hypothetical protein JWM80_4000 [Cyanobacteria bacterium RYN_339]|nr:hypothetical protein [Cyanobacteria bacterium RYN_339]